MNYIIEGSFCQTWNSSNTTNIKIFLWNVAHFYYKLCIHSSTKYIKFLHFLQHIKFGMICYFFDCVKFVFGMMIYSRRKRYWYTLLRKQYWLLSLLNPFIGFVNWFFASFLYCSFHCYRPFQYCDRKMFLFIVLNSHSEK